MQKLFIFILATLLPLYIAFPREGSPVGTGSSDDKTLSPYFEVQGASDVEGLPLYSTTADVKIMGVIADVTVRQVYRNTGKKAIEAIYVFPASTRAAVYGMKMKVGERVLKAEIQKREQARQTYEKAKNEGKSASLLEQQRPNVFQMNVANILPGDTITVELKYTELLIPEAGVYEFVYPTVVGPRYSNRKEASAGTRDKFVNTPYKHEGGKSDYKFDINIELAAGMPIEEAMSSSHKIKVDFNEDKSNANIRLDKSEKAGGNRDFILSYRLAGGKIKTGLLLSKNGSENFFMLMLQPPKRVIPEQVPPRDYIFVVDVSGSMYGFPLNISKAMIKNLLGSLRPMDKFNILLFAGSSSFLSCESMPATPENIKNAIGFIDEQKGGGGTELLPAMKKALSVPKEDGFSRTIVVLTDGFVDVEEETFDLVKNNLDKANIFAFGIGTSVNRLLIEGMARIGQGTGFVVTNEKFAQEQAEKFRKYIENPVMTDIKVNFARFTTLDVEPKTIPDVLAERPIILFGKWTGDPTGAITVSGLNGTQRLKVDIPLSNFARMDSTNALKYLWARNKISELSDYNSIKERKEREDQIADMGIKYNLLTKYTSFVAVDYIARSDGQLETVKQPLPLPEGVSDKAVGSASPLMAKSLSNQGSVINNVSREGITEIVATPSGVMNAGLGYDSKRSARISSDLNLREVQDEDEFFAIEKSAEVDINELAKNIQYPEIAKKASIEGKVVVRVLVDKDGKAKKTSIIYSDSKFFEQPALDAIRKTKYIPAIHNGQPVQCWISVPVNFRLVNNNPDITIDEISTEGDIEDLTNKKVDIPAKVDMEDLKNKIDYPSEAIRKGLKGKVIVKVLVSPTGTPTKSKIESSDNVIFNIPAQKAAMQGIYTSAIKDGKTVNSWISVPIEFNPDDIRISYEPTGRGTYITNTGVEFRETARGTGDEIKKGNNITLNIKVFSEDCGKITDTYQKGKPITFSYMKGSAQYKGLEDGLAGIKAGGRRTIYIPEWVAKDDENLKYNGKNEYIIEAEVVEIK